MAKPIGISKLRVRQAPNREWGIWIMNEGGYYIYPILTFPNIEEAIELGNKIGKVLNLPCDVIRSVFYLEKKKSKSVSNSNKKKIIDGKIRDKTCSQCGEHFRGNSDICICPRCNGKKIR